MEIITSVEQARIPVTVMRVRGKIDSSTFQAFQSKAEELIGSGARHLLVDLADAPFISSAGLRAIHNIFNQLRAIHKDMNDDDLRKSMSAGAYKSPYLKACGLSPEVREVFTLGGFDIYIESHEDTGSALASF
ncbi:MAG: STAS domain-containing protein [Chloroflexi bacterium]|nr:STAS domain-containing protein [Chloroflexota bacterium]